VERTNSELYKLEAVIKSLRNDLTHTKITAKILTGIDNINLKLSGELPDPVFNIDEAKSFVNKRWDVKTTEEQVEYSTARVISAYGEHLPSVYLDGAYILYQEKKPANTRDYYFSLGAEIPLFSGGIVLAKVREAESIKRQSELNLSKTRRLAEQDIIDAYQSWESSMKEAEAFKKALVSAEENYNIIKNEYRLNLVTILDVITSLKSLQSARDDYERTELQHRLNRIRLGIAINELSGPNIRILKDK
jgi:outer membrane protein TolC